jgi:hypothetical protein
MLQEVRKMKITKKTVSKFLVRELASASIARPIDKGAGIIIKKIPAVAKAGAKANTAIGFGVAIASGVIGDVIVDKLIDEAGGFGHKKNYKKRKHHKKTRKQENKKHLKIEGLPTEEVNEDKEADEEVSEE